jgi:hypothetical protein
VPFVLILGSVTWIPVWLAMLVCYGLPIARAQTLAMAGLAGEERGEAVVGTLCMVVSVAATLALPGGFAWLHARRAVGPWTTLALSTLGVLCGGAATALSLARGARRRSLVADAEAGRAPGFRVVPSDDGRVLVRVASGGEGYRVADLEQELFELDARGEATRAKPLAAAARR